MVRTLGFVVIVVEYLTVGVLGAVGCMAISRRFLSPKWESVFYGAFLALIGAFYLAFAAYFDAAGAWRLEMAAVLVFVVLGIVGARVPAVLMLGYIAHALWDLMHELQQHGAISVFTPGEATSVPLGYGPFCAAFDLAVAVYVWRRRHEWSAAWTLAASGRGERGLGSAQH
jgi:hypothetical protein